MEELNIDIEDQAIVDINKNYYLSVIPERF